MKKDRFLSARLGIEFDWETGQLTVAQKKELIAFAIRIKFGDAIAGCKDKAEAEVRLADIAEKYKIVMT